MDIRAGENTISGVYSFRPHKLLVDGVECEAIEIGAAGAIPEAALASIATDGLETEQGTFAGYTQHTLTTVTFIKPPVTAEKVAEEKDVVIATVLGALNDGQALQFTDLYPLLTGDGQAVEAGNRRRFGNGLYKANATLWDRPDQCPDAKPTLWTLITGSGGVEDWVQPTGAHDAYAKGAKVTHNGKRWVSTAYGNVWAPGVYGWANG